MSELMTIIKDYRVVIATDPDGTFVAASTASPYFCFEGKSEKEVIDKAARALIFFASSVSAD